MSCYRSGLFTSTCPEGAAHHDAYSLVAGGRVRVETMGVLLWPSSLEIRDAADGFAANWAAKI